METAVGISSRLLGALIAEADASPDREVCGLLFGTPAMIEAANAAGNVAANPADSFEIDPAVLIAAHRAMRDGGPWLIGHYHSHPSGDADPSARDAAAASPGDLWLIIARGEARLWRAVAGGALHGRFDRVPIDVALPCAAGPASP